MTESTDAIAAFQAWLVDYLESPAGMRQVQLDRGIELARARRAAFLERIKTNPRQALESAVPMVVRQQLPREIVELLEERVNGTAALRVFQGDRFGAKPWAQTHRVAEFSSGQTYEAQVYGRRAEETRWLASVSLWGVAMDHVLALADSPVRMLETGELPNASSRITTACPVCGTERPVDTRELRPVTADTPAVEAFGETFFCCDSSHALVYGEQLLQAEGSSGGPFAFTGILPAAPTPSVGNVKVMVIPMTFADQNDVPSSESALYQMMRDIAAHFAQASYGKLTLIPTVTPPVKLPHNEAWYVQKDTSNGGSIDGLGLEHSHARAEARALGFDDAEYDCVVVRLRGGPRATGGWGGGSSVWTYSDGTGVVAHELGHVFGLGHANFWNTSGTSTIGTGANDEYGDSFDLMGGGGIPNGHYSPPGKNQVRWLPDTFLTEITASGIYRIYAHDQPVLDPSKRYALKVRKDNLRTYWGELRGVYTGSTSRPWADYGLVLGWRFPGGGGSYRQLLDTTPGTPFGKDDAPLSLGRTFSDTEAGIHLTTIRVNPATADDAKSVEVVVNLGDFTSNQPPTLELRASATVVPMNVPVIFTATATDPEGDLLAYAWQHFGDANYRAVSPNSAVITRAFAASGTYVVSCTVSDMKGGTATRNVLVTVGNGGGKFTLSGRLTLDGQGLANVLVNANSANGVITDSDGHFTIPNLSSGIYVVTPLLYGYAFTEFFNNSVTLGPDFSGADFEATASPRVSLMASVPATTEGGTAPGQFLLTRTGDVTLPLTVNLVGPSGTATSSADYILAPALASGSQGFMTLTFAAGANSVAVNVTPVNDASAEGAETVVLELAAGNGYIVENPARATVVIDDDDIRLPKVSLAVAESKTMEGSESPALITFTRTGPTTTALAVNYGVSGTATAAEDYRPLSGSLTIPDGSSSVQLEIKSVNDNLSESIETVTVAIRSGTTFLADPVATNATISIVDDDAQVVTVSATDAVATERNLSEPGVAADTGTFLVTRSGDLSAPLTVYYSVSGSSSGALATALHGVDYEALPGVLVIPAGQSHGAVTIVPLWDGLGEGPESVGLQLGAGPTNYRLGTSNSATLTIADASDPPYVDVIGVENAVEGGATGRFRLTLRGSTGGNVVVYYTLSGTATSGDDFTPLPGSVTLNGDGINTVEVNVTPNNDTRVEDLETLTLTLTPSSAYQVFEPTASATIWILDNEQPTLFVDAHQTSYPPAISENGGSASFYISRPGSTANSLTVNYTMTGTAVNGQDYQALSGTTNIAAGALGVDIPIVAINDTLAEGTETVTFNFAPGAYGQGPSATLYLNDNESAALTVGFPTNAAVGNESVTWVEIPVLLSAASATPVTVEYLVDTGSRSSSTASGTALSPLPYWVRCDRLSNTVIGSVSPDGTNWTDVSTQDVAMPSASYLAGLYVCSFNTSLRSTSVFDHVIITNLDPGGSIGSRTGANIGSTSLSGSTTVAGDIYTVAGAGDNVEGTTDQGYFAYWTIRNSARCTIIARVVSQQNTASGATAGVMLREATANNVRRGYMSATPGRGFEFHYRTNTAATEAKKTHYPNVPLWVRLQRTGGVMQAFQSGDGENWTPVGADLELGFGPEVLAGLAVSSQDDDLLATVVMDHVSISPGPAPPLEGRTVGFTATQGAHTEAAGVYSISGAADGINGTSDDFYFVAAPFAGDFTLTARITGLESAAASAQAGLCVRENIGRRCRSLFIGGRPGASAQTTWRATTLTLANNVDIDFRLDPGILEFPPGTLSQHLLLKVVNDSRPEADEPITIILRHANGARLGTAAFTYLVVDDDSASALPLVGFAAANSSASESSHFTWVPVTLSAPASSTVSVDYTVQAGTAEANQDFTPASGTLTFAPGDTVQSIEVTLANDTVIEASETVLLTLTHPTGALANTLNEHILTMLDDDQPRVQILATNTNAAETGASATLTLIRTGSTNSDLPVNLTLSGTATAGHDYTGIDTTVIIPAGARELALTLSPIQDDTPEGTETALVAIAPSPDYTVEPPSSLSISIADDDRNTVMIIATDDIAREGGDTGAFKLTRTGNTNDPLMVTLTLTGTATSGSDYTTTPTRITTVAFAIGQSESTISVSPIDDVQTEGDETVLVQITAGAYDIAEPGYASLTLLDNDLPPTVFIHSPAASGVVVRPGNGVEFSAEADNQGATTPLHYHWTQATGPGAVVFEAPHAPVSPASFSAPGAYLVRVTASNAQFSASDQIYVNVCDTAALVPADWISSDIGPATWRGYAGYSGSNWIISAAGTGYKSSSDRAQALTRQVSGDGSLVARVTSITGPTAAEAGLSVRDSMHRYARRAVLVYQASSKTLRFRPRIKNNTTDFAVSVPGLNLPLWLKLERHAETNAVAGFYATDQDGAPGPWTQIGTNAIIAMDAVADYSLTADSGSDTTPATAWFDHLALSPIPEGPGILVEDFGDGTQVGTYNYHQATDTHTLAGDGSLDSSGLFWGQQFIGDFVLTALMLDASSNANDARSGIMIRDSMDNGPMVFLGRNPTGSFSCYVWRTNPKGGTSGLSGITQKQRWLRLIRRGNTITALHAPNNSGVPGAWVQLGQPQTVFLQPVVMTGLYCDNAGGVGLNTASFTKFTVTALQQAPRVDAGLAPANLVPPITLNGLVTDDNLPAPLITWWSAATAPGPVTFANSNALMTTASFSASGFYTLRLWADDGAARTCQDLKFNYAPSAFLAWQWSNFADGPANPDAAPETDPDGDGANNLEEYALGTDPNLAGWSPIRVALEKLGSDEYLQVAIPRNPLATDVILSVTASRELWPGAWSAEGLVMEVDTSELLVVRDSFAVSENPQRYLRIVVSFR